MTTRDPFPDQAPAMGPEDQLRALRDSERGPLTRIDPGVMATWVKETDPVVRGLVYLDLLSRLIAEPWLMSVPELSTLGFGMGQDKEAHAAVDQMDPEVAILFREAIIDDAFGIREDKPKRYEQEYHRKKMLEQRYTEEAEAYADRVTGGQAIGRRIFKSQFGDPKWDAAFREKFEELSNTPAEQYEQDFLDSQLHQVGNANDTDLEVVRHALQPQGMSETQQKVKDYGNLAIETMGALAASYMIFKGAVQPGVGSVGAQAAKLFARPSMQTFARGLAQVGATKSAQVVWTGAKVLAGVSSAAAIGGQVISAGMAGVGPTGVRRPGDADGHLYPSDRVNLLVDELGKTEGRDGLIQPDMVTGPQAASDTGQPQPSEGNVFQAIGNAVGKRFGDDPSQLTNLAQQTSMVPGAELVTQMAGRYFNTQAPPSAAASTGGSTSSQDWMQRAPGAAGAPTSAYEDNPYVGVSEGYTTRGERPLYRYSDIDHLMGAWTPMALERIESEMIRAGLIDPKAKVNGMGYVPGMKGEHLRQGIEGLLTVSNRHGTSWTKMLVDLAEANIEEVEADPLRPGRVIAPYLPPDYATLSQTAKNAVKQSLGRNINDWELKMLADAMAGDYRAQYDQAVNEEKLIWEAEGRAQDSGAFEDVPSVGSKIDPMARFAERFEKQFKGELDEREQTLQVEAATGNLFGGLSRLSGMVG